MNKNKANLYIDFDGTIANSIKRLVDMLNEKFNENKNWLDIKQYDATDLFPQCTQEDIINIFSSEEFFDDLEFLDGFFDTIKKHQDKFNIHIATIGTEQNLKYKKIFCENNFDFPFEFIGIVKNGVGKEKIDMSNGIIIDDHIENLVRSNASHKILFCNFIDTEWNNIEIDSELDLDPNVWELDNWYEVEDILNFIMRNNLLEE